MTSPIRTFLYGSCVGRDMYEMAGKNLGLEKIHTIARQSIVSAFHPADPSLWDLQKISSPYQRKNTLGDIQSTLCTNLAAHAQNTDVVVIDLVDERAGFWRLPDGSAFTPLPANRRAAIKPYLEMGGERYKFTGKRYHHHFNLAAKQLAEFLKKLELFDRTIILDIPMSTAIAPTGINRDGASEAARIDEGHRYGLPLLRCFEIMEGLGFQMAGCQDHQPEMVHDHIWGLAPFHYDQKSYDLMAEKVVQFTCQK